MLLFYSTIPVKILDFPQFPRNSIRTVITLFLDFESSWLLLAGPLWEGAGTTSTQPLGYDSDGCDAVSFPLKWLTVHYCPCSAFPSCGQTLCNKAPPCTAEALFFVLALPVSIKDDLASLSGRPTLLATPLFTPVSPI